MLVVAKDTVVMDITALDKLAGTALEYANWIDEYETVAAEVIIDTVVVTVSPSGCLNRPIFPEPSSENQTRANIAKTTATGPNNDLR